MTPDDDPRFTMGSLNMLDASRFLGIPRQTFHRWARGYERGDALLHVLDGGRRREAAVTFVALAEAHVLEALRRAGVMWSTVVAHSVQRGPRMAQYGSALRMLSRSVRQARPALR